MLSSEWTIKLRSWIIKIGLIVTLIWAIDTGHFWQYLCIVILYIAIFRRDDFIGTYKSVKNKIELLVYGENK